MARHWLGSIYTSGRSVGVGIGRGSRAGAGARTRHSPSSPARRGSREPRPAAPRDGRAGAEHRANARPGRELYMGAHLLLFNNYVAILVPTQFIALHYISSSYNVHNGAT